MLRRIHKLALFNRGLLPVLEKFFSRESKALLEAAFATIVECYRRVHSAEPDVRSLFPFLFRFVTAKIILSHPGELARQVPQSATERGQDRRDHGPEQKMVRTSRKH
jgi:hypothetical protein